MWPASSGTHNAGLAAGRNGGEEALPAAPGEENTRRLIHLPIIDRPTIKKQMASIAHKSVMAELTALQKDLERYHRAGERDDKEGLTGHDPAREHGGAGHFATIAWLSRQLGETDWEIMWEVDRQNAKCHAP